MGDCMNWLKQQQAWVRTVVFSSAAIVLAGLITLLSIAVIAPAVAFARAGALISSDPAGAFESFQRMGDRRNAAERAAQIQADVIASRTEPTMEFAGDTWLVLEQRDGRALLLLESVLPQAVAYHQAFEDITWEESDLRAFLNDAFLQGFGEQYRARIVPTQLVNRNHADYGTRGGANTTDYVFLLSIAEARLYFATDFDRVAQSGSTNVFWWLRSPGLYQNLAATVLANGEVGFAGSPVNGALGARMVRPAIWVTL